jgi:hypothetical protein
MAVLLSKLHKYALPLCLFEKSKCVKKISDAFYITNKCPFSCLNIRDDLCVNVFMRKSPR